MRGMATILVADDNRANRDAMAALLETAGHRVVSAANGREALERAREHRPELVISDVLMPEMDGYELARRLHLDPATAATTVLFYTAYFGTHEAKELALAHGVARVLVKPSDNDAILAAVNEVLVHNPAWVAPHHFAGTEPLAVAPEEPLGANVLLAGATVIAAADSPRTADALAARGLAVVTLDISEMRKADAALTCMSLISERA